MTAPQDRRAALFRDFQEALLFKSGNVELDRLGRESLLLSVSDDPDFVSEWHRLVGSEQAVLDLHLGGPGVVHNMTRADRFASFVSHLATTVQRAAREATGRKRYPRQLLVEGVQPGSVRVVLRAPAPVIPRNQAVDDLTAASTVDSNALRLVATIIAHANDPAHDSIVTAAVQSLPVPARIPLRSAIDQVQGTGWEIDGSISQRGFGYSELNLTSQGATRLRLELDAKAEKKYTEDMFGRISGSKDIEGIVWFTPEGGSEFRARVADDSNLRRRVVEYQLDHPRVSARFNVVETHVGGADRTSIRTAHILQGVSLAPTGTQASLDDG
ncbi:hypothetical protein ACK12G_29350 [Mycolicibacterium wolinskyi]|uniref:hypothetical protein n=1 Tax=Mycolicibacterium wolinskyi TaxID=59750 RepID=UPI0039178D27